MKKIISAVMILVFSGSVVLNIYLLRGNIHNLLTGFPAYHLTGNKKAGTRLENGSGASIDLKNRDTVSDISTKKSDEKLTRLDYSRLDSVSNNMLSWGLPGNSRHNPPEVPAAAARLLDKYGAICLGDTASRKVYLTFDEGYENGYTTAILDTLKKNGIRTIFFVTKSYVQKNPDLIKRMLDDGHKIGSHTVSHPSLPLVDNDSLEKELAGFDEYFFSLFNIHFKYMRPPNGEYSERVLEAAGELGYKTVFWSFAYLDYDVNNQKGAEYAYNKVMDNLHNGAVILLHAVSKDNAGALDRIIQGIRERGYDPCPFDL